LGPQVFKEFVSFCSEFGDVSCIPTDVFLAPMVPGQDTAVHLESGKHLLIKFLSTSADLDDQGRRIVRKTRLIRSRCSL